MVILSRRCLQRHVCLFHLSHLCTNFLVDAPKFTEVGRGMALCTVFVHHGRFCQIDMLESAAEQESSDEAKAAFLGTTQLQARLACQIKVYICEYYVHVCVNMTACVCVCVCVCVWRAFKMRAANVKIQHVQITTTNLLLLYHYYYYYYNFYCYI